METGSEIISTTILPLPLIQVGQLSVTGKRMWPKYWLTCLSLPRKSMVTLTDRLDMTIVAVDWDIKRQNNNNLYKHILILKL